MWSAPAPSAPSTIGPIRLVSPVAVSTTAPAPSANTAAVVRSSGSRIRDIRSAPMTSTHWARPASIWPVPTASADRKPVHAAPMSNAPARTAPSSWATSGAAFGMTSSGVVVATSTRSTCSGETPARRSAAAPALVAWVVRRSSGSATCRARIPVRRTIHSSLTPIRAAISALGTTLRGRLAPTDAIAAPSARRPERTCPLTRGRSGALASSCSCMTQSPKKWPMPTATRPKPDTRGVGRVGLQASPNRPPGAGRAVTRPPVPSAPGWSPSVPSGPTPAAPRPSRRTQRRQAGCVIERGIEIRAVEQVVAGQELLGLGERPVGELGLSVALADGGRGVRALEGVAADRDAGLHAGSACTRRNGTRSPGAAPGSPRRRPPGCRSRACTGASRLLGSVGRSLCGFNRMTDERAAFRHARPSIVLRQGSTSDRGRARCRAGPASLRSGPPAARAGRARADCRIVGATWVVSTHRSDELGRTAPGA